MGCSSPIQAFLVPLPRFSRERGAGTVRVTFAPADPQRSWELRSNQQFVCKTPCTRWINPVETYQFRAESGPSLETIDVPSLSAYVGSSDLEVRAHPRDRGAFAGGIVATGVGGGFAFIGGFLALMGGMADRKGLTVGGAITAGVGLAAIAPGVWLITSSGSKVEILSDGAPIPSAAAAPGLGLGGSF